MKFLSLVVAAQLLGLITAARAQSSPAPNESPKSTTNTATAPSAATPAPSPSAPVEPPSLIPANILPAPASLPPIPAAPDLEKLSSAFRQTSLGKAADEYRLHLQMTELETRIRNDADLHALKSAASQAPTDRERRKRMKSYYQRYYGKVRALAGTRELKSYLTAQEAAHELVLLQPRVRHETDEAEAAALATAKAGASIAPGPTPDQARASEALRP